MAVPPRLLDPAPIRRARFLVMAETPQEAAQTAPRVALVLGVIEVGPELAHGIGRTARLLVLDGQAEAEPRVFGTSLEHPLERRNAIAGRIVRGRPGWGCG